jgi:ElaB/YqjD/DUF883 family membrane-anchored ribosome-binding protein
MEVLLMIDLTREIRERAERMSNEMKGFVQDVGDEMRSMGELMKEKAEKLSNEIKDKLIR